MRSARKETNAFPNCRCRFGFLREEAACGQRYFNYFWRLRYLSFPSVQKFLLIQQEANKGNEGKNRIVHNIRWDAMRLREGRDRAFRQKITPFAKPRRLANGPTDATSCWSQHPRKNGLMRSHHRRRDPAATLPPSFIASPKRAKPLSSLPERAGDCRSSANTSSRRASSLAPSACQRGSVQSTCRKLPIIRS